MIFVLGACAFGLEAIFLRWPMVRTVLQFLSLTYIAYLSYRIATANTNSLDPGSNKSKPLKAYESALFQIINPKAFAIVTSLISTFSLPGADYLGSVFFIGIVMVGVCIPAVAFWTLFGTLIKSWLRRPWLLRTFNVSMAILSLGSVLWGML
jgi:threonine/homoserine/homoserine lactone efflux protein